MKKLIVFTCIVMMGSSVFSQQGPRDLRKGPSEEGNPGDRIEAILELSEAQKTKIGDLRTAHLKEVAPLSNELDIKRAQLKAAVESGDKKIDPIIQEINVIQGKLFSSKTYHQIAVREVLDDDQKLRFDQMKKHKPDMTRRGNRR